MLTHRGFEWALGLLSFLQSDEGAVGLRDPSLGRNVAPESRMRAAVRATYAVAILHTGRTQGLADVWEEVNKKPKNTRSGPTYPDFSCEPWQGASPPADSWDMLPP